ncbi:hypothetical protein [uncultured Brevundimonas sp.]|uniref:hypothetical protein n=1 Tax=uncultured Brevundimonas sp. TaxID=213418 RepID=UPI0025E24A1E|nr:hypothetical protein [uncultured Brevundimonas sp.]
MTSSRPRHSDRRRSGSIKPIAFGKPEWRALIELAKSCAVDALSQGDEAEEEGQDAALRLMTLGNRVNAASSSVFAREAGAATDDAARAFLRVTRAFARRETPGRTRRALAPMMAAGAEFLDDALHGLATDAFKRAHAGRPEVWG